MTLDPAAMLTFHTPQVSLDEGVTRALHAAQAAA